MAHWVRFIPTGRETVSLEQLAEDIQRLDPAYALMQDLTLTFDGDACARLELSEEEDPRFDAERDALLAAIERHVDEDGVREVRAVLRSAQQILAMRVLPGTLGRDDALERLSPLVDSLCARYPGLLQADGEGFYRGEELVLEME